MFYFQTGRFLIVKGSILIISSKQWALTRNVPVKLEHMVIVIITQKLCSKRWSTPARKRFLHLMDGLL